jgi:hypothetical protein
MVIDFLTLSQGDRAAALEIAVCDHNINYAKTMYMIDLVHQVVTGHAADIWEPGCYRWFVTESMLYAVAVRCNTAPACPRYDASDKIAHEERSADI